MPGGILESGGTESNPVEIISSETLPANNDWQGLELINKHSQLEGSFLVIRHAEYAVASKDRFNYDFHYITFENNNNSFSMPPSPDGDLKINTYHCRFIDSPINYLNYSNGNVEFVFENCFFAGSSTNIGNPTSVIFKNMIIALAPKSGGMSLP